MFVAPSRDPLSQPDLQKSLEITEVDELLEGKDPHDLWSLSLMSIPIHLEHAFTCPFDVQTPKAILCSG
jgi:hypothetical protein